MASIKEYRKDGKIVSYYFTACLGRDSNGNQIRKYTTWTLPKGIGQARAPKEAAKQAALWEESLKAEPESIKPEKAPVTQPTERKDDFIGFIEQTWFPLKVSGNNRKPKTIAFYESATKIIKAYFKGKYLQEISAIDIDKYLCFLRTE